MTPLEIIGLIFAAALGALAAKKYKFGPYLEQEHEFDLTPTGPLEPPVVPQDAPKPPEPPPTIPESEPAPQPLLWATPKQAYHSVRVICDEMLPLEKTVELPDLGHFYPKDLICACIYQESRFDNKAVGKNPGSTDWGIVQVNDYWQIGKGKQFPSVDFVVSNPEQCVRWMINCYIQKDLWLWSSYKSGVYKQWLSPGSPMWALSK